MPNDISRPGEGEAVAKRPQGVSAQARRSYAWAALVAGIVLFLAINILSNAWLRAGGPLKRMQGVKDEEEG